MTHETIVEDHRIAYSGIKKELEPYVTQDVYEHLVLSLNVLKQMDEDCVVYSYHRALCDYWFEPLDKRQEVDVA